MFSIKLFGHPQVLVHDKEINLARRKSRALVFYIGAQPGPVARQSLLDIFWPDLIRASALQSLRSTLSSIKRVMGAAFEVDAAYIGLGAGVKVDAAEFTAAVDRAGNQIDDLRAGLAIYTGEFMQDFYLPDSLVFEDWLTRQRELYRQQALRGYTRLAGLYKANREYKLAIKSLDRALDIQPLQEDIQRERIYLYHLAGDRPGAIQRYQDLLKLLDEELGVPPMAETRALYDDILLERVTMDTASIQKRPVLSGRVLQKDFQELPFVGRKRDLSELQQALHQGKLALIEGEAGVGKSRLILEMARQLGVRGLVGSAYELEQNLPYQPIVEALRNAFDGSDGELLQKAVKQQLSNIWLVEISRVLPEMDLGGVGESRSQTGVDEARLWEGIRQTLMIIAQLQPVLLVVDDLHWAGNSTLGLLSYLIRQDEAPGLFFAASIRTATTNPAIRTFLQSLSRKDLLYQHWLDRLSPEAVLKLARRISPKFAPPLADWLQKKSEGNPYILTELVKSARQRSLLQPNGMLNLSLLSTEASIPQTVYSLLQARLEKLSEPARRILEAAAVNGRQFAFEVVAAAAGLSEMAAIEAMEELLNQGLVQKEEAGYFLMDHSLILDVVYQEIRDLRRRFLHRKVAEAIESQMPGRLEDKAGSLAWHFSQAGDLKQAAEYARMAGNHALKLAAWREAIRYFEIVLRGDETEQREKDWENLAQAFARASEFAQATEAYRQAITIAQRNLKDGTVIAGLQLAMARSLLPQGRIDEVVQIAQQICQKNQPENAIIAELLWGTALSVKGVDLKSAMEHLHRAKVLWAQNPGSPLSTLGQIWFEIGSVEAQLGDLEMALQSYQQALEVVSKDNQIYGLELSILAYNNLAYHKHLLGMPEAEEDALQGLSISQKNGMLGLQTYLNSTLGEIALAAGEFEKAEMFFEKGLDLAQRFNITERIAGITANQGLLAKERGRSELALHYLSTALGQAQALGAEHLKAQIHLWLTPMLPGEAGREHLALAKDIATHSQRRRLLEQAAELEKRLFG